jgi:hypothetical protein
MTDLRFAISWPVCHHCFNAVKAEISKVPRVDSMLIESDTQLDHCRR